MMKSLAGLRHPLHRDWVALVVVLVTGLFTSYQADKSDKIIDSFAKMASELVLGVVVRIKGGIKTPSDIRNVTQLR